MTRNDVCIKEAIRSFFKRNKTVGVPLSKLFKRFTLDDVCPVISQDRFETELLEMNKKIILDLRKNCVEHALKHGVNSYPSFLKACGENAVTKKFWDKTVESLNIPSSKPQIVETEKSGDFKEKMPLNWGIMSKGERIDFVGKIQDKEFKEFVLKQDKSLSQYFKGASKWADKKSPINLYVNLFSFSSKTTSEEAKCLVKSLIESLNMLGRARLQYVELTDPPVVEIREVRR